LATATEGRANPGGAKKQSIVARGGAQSRRRSDPPGGGTGIKAQWLHAPRANRL